MKQTRPLSEYTRCPKLPNFTKFFKNAMYNVMSPEVNLSVCLLILGSTCYEKQYQI